MFHCLHGIMYKYAKIINFLNSFCSYWPSCHYLGTYSCPNSRKASPVQKAELGKYFHRFLEFSFFSQEAPGTLSHGCPAPLLLCISWRYLLSMARTVYPFTQRHATQTRFHVLSLFRILKNHSAEKILGQTTRSLSLQQVKRERPFCCLWNHSSTLRNYKTCCKLCVLYDCIWIYFSLPYDYYVIIVPVLSKH